MEAVHGPQNGNLRLREQPGATGKPCVSVAPLRDLIRDVGRFTSVMVLRFMLRSSES
jgi:hypothetical protein